LHYFEGDAPSPAVSPLSFLFALVED
jgi:hypothetical protein